jgi:Tat protein translocase TatC
VVKLDDPRIGRTLDAEGGEDAGLVRMSFGDHLDELRKRLFRAVLAVVVAVLAMLPFHNAVMDVITQPYRLLWRQYYLEHEAGLEERAAAGTLTEEVEKDWVQFMRKERVRILDGTYPHPFLLPEKSGCKLPYELVAVGGIEDIWTFMMAALIFAGVLASPVVIWQAWAFVAAGLYPRERRVFYRYFPFLVALFAGGVLFGYYLAVPYGLGFLIRLQVSGIVTSMLSVANYFTFLLAVGAAMGLVFQLPLVMVALQKIGLVRHRTYVKNWRIMVLIIFIVAAVLTPPDPFSMTIMAAPTLCLYLLGLVLTKIGSRHEPDYGVAAAAPES